MPYLLRVELPDVPGSLGRVAGAIGEAGGDIEAIEIVEHRSEGTAVDDVLLEMAHGVMPDSVVYACNQLDGVRVLWISRYAAGLASCERDLVVVNHDAFGYLTKYGLELEAIAGLSPDSEPTAADVARLQDLIEDEGVTTVFSETLVSPETAETLARDAGVEADVLDPIEGLANTTADEDYLSLMRANLDALRAANGC